MDEGGVEGMSLRGADGRDEAAARERGGGVPGGGHGRGAKGTSGADGESGRSGGGDGPASRLPERVRAAVLPLTALALLATTAALAAGFWYAPTLDERACTGVLGTDDPECFTAPLAQKLFYVHVPAAFAAYGALAVMAAATLVHMFGPRRHPEWFHLARAAVSVGVLFATITLATGMIWGAAEWGRAWDWTNQKLVLTLVLWLIYVAYLVLDRELRDHAKRAEVVGSYGVLGFVSVPLSYWATEFPHPQVLGSRAPEGAGITEPHILQAFLLATVAFLLLAAALIAIRFLLNLPEEEPEEYRLGGTP